MFLCRNIHPSWKLGLVDVSIELKSIHYFDGCLETPLSTAEQNLANAHIMVMIRLRR